MSWLVAILQVLTVLLGISVISAHHVRFGTGFREWFTLNPMCPRPSPRTVYSPFPKWERLQLALRCQWWEFKVRYITWNHLKFLEHQTCWKLFNVNHITSINNTISRCRYLYIVFVNTCIFMQFIFWESLKSVIEFFIMLAFISLMVSS